MRRAVPTRAVRLLNRRRRPVAVALAALGAACAGLAVRPAPTVAVLAAAHDLGGGTLSVSDLTTVHLPEEAVPDGALRPGARVTGRVLTAPARRGEPITDLRLLGPALIDAYGPGMLATPVRVTDAASARLLRPGDVIDVIASSAGWDDLAPPLPPDPDPAATSDHDPGAAPTGPSSRAAVPQSAAAGSANPRTSTAAHAVTVIAVPNGSRWGGSAGSMSESGALVVLATTPDQAARLAQAGTSSRLSITIHGRGR
ncbi:RcpC/CpaB family pilus assembly protein [Sphaerisporangium dianthi]|uniref:RcpC/CpaB family pilus assembly protein n=1 Tax=Sphaerisporangium dianthi TaxID=1436120 RepID=A0ABV9CU05_9ACTN